MAQQYGYGQYQQVPPQYQQYYSNQQMPYQQVAPVVQQQPKQDEEYDSGAEGNQNSPSRAIIYSKEQWIKVTYNNKTKRINNPPKALSDLVKELKSRFKDLSDDLDRDSSLCLQIFYIDEEGEEIYIEDSSDLIRAYKYAEIVCDNKNVLKFIIQSSKSGGIPQEQISYPQDPDINKMQQMLTQLQKEDQAHPNNMGQEQNAVVEKLIADQSQQQQLHDMDQRLNQLLVQDNSMFISESNGIDYRFTTMLNDFNPSQKQPSINPQSQNFEMSMRQPPPSQMNPPPFQPQPMTAEQKFEQSQSHSLFNNPPAPVFSNQPPIYNNPPPFEQPVIPNGNPIAPPGQYQNPNNMFPPASPQNLPPQNLPPQNLPPQNLPPQNLPPQPQNQFGQNPANMPPPNMPPSYMPPPQNFYPVPPYNQNQFNPNPSYSYNMPPPNDYQRENSSLLPPPQQYQPYPGYQQNPGPMDSMPLNNPNMNQNLMSASVQNQSSILESNQGPKIIPQEPKSNAAPPVGPLQVKYIPMYFKIGKCSDQNILKNNKFKSGGLKGLVKQFNDASSLEEQKKFAIILSHKECQERAFPGQEIFFRWVIQNQSYHKWDKNITFKNFNNDPEYQVPLFNIFDKDRLESGQIRELAIRVYVPPDCKKNQIKVEYSLVNSKGVRFGEPLVGIIDIVGNNDNHGIVGSSLANQAPVYNQIPAPPMPQPSYQMMPQNNNAVRLDEDFLSALGFSLSDEGYGEYDTCLKVLRDCQGDYDRAKQVLTKMMHEKFAR